jgi:hypothetical protein
LYDCLAVSILLSRYSKAMFSVSNQSQDPAEICRHVECCSRQLMQAHDATAVNGSSVGHFTSALAQFSKMQQLVISLPFHQHSA